VTVEAVQFVAETALPRQAPAVRDELQIALKLPPPPIELAMAIELQTDGFAATIHLAVAPASEGEPHVLRYRDSHVRCALDSEHDRLLIGIPVASVIIQANPQSLLGSSVSLRLTSSREAARSAGFDRFLQFDRERNTTLVDGRPPERREAAQIAHSLLEELISPQAACRRLEHMQLESDVQLVALELVKELGTPRILRAQAWVTVMDPAASAAEYHRAVVRAREAATLEPENPDGQHVLGAACYRAGEYQAAVAALRRALELAEEDREAKLTFLAMAEHALGNAAAARGLLDEALRLSGEPSSPEARRLLDEASRLLAR
jgi:tetratricopeptide (TPR) repeat protein